MLWSYCHYCLFVKYICFCCWLHSIFITFVFNYSYFFSLRHTQSKYVGVHFPKSFKWKKIQRFCFQMENFCSIRYINIWADAMCICKCYRTLFFASLFAQSSFVTCLSMLHLNVACTMNAFLWIKFALGRLLVVCLENISISEKIP